MAVGRIKRLVCILAGCCLLVAPLGCSFHRTERGFVVGSQWSLEYNHVPWLAFRSANDADCDHGDGNPVAGNAEKSAESDAPSAQKVAGKPELLPWRGRLRGYRLGARIFRKNEPIEQQTPSAEMAARDCPNFRVSENGTVPFDATKPPATPVPIPPNAPKYNKEPTFSTETGQLQLPNS